MTAFILPKRGTGQQNKADQAIYDEQMEAFCAGIIELIGLDFEVGARGWGYVCEAHNLITKADIDRAEKLVNDCRKSGMLPLDICLVDEGRAFDHVQRIDDETPEEQAEWIVDYINTAHSDYWPESFWDDQEFYVQMVVEKSTLKSLFDPVCAEFFVPLATASGWCDINMRADMMRRFAEKESDGKQGVLLYGGDHDPGGLQISNYLRANMEAVSDAVGGWSPDQLIIERFGLNFDFIEKHGLTWIDNLITGAKGKMKSICLSDKRHIDHNKPYVQNYLKQFCGPKKGDKWTNPRKVEGEALVRVPDLGRDLCRQAILKYVSADAPDLYAERIRPAREQVREEMLRLLAEVQ